LLKEMKMPVDVFHRDLGVNHMNNMLTADDPRYLEMFDPAKEAVSQGGMVLGDLTDAMNALRNKGPLLKGSLLELMGLPEAHPRYNQPREHYTLFSFELCDRAFRENLLFSSKVYTESAGVTQLGNVVLMMVGDEHRRQRSVVQPMFVRPRVSTWWKRNWIDDAVNTLLDRLHDKQTADLNQELCARLPVHVVSRGMGLSGEDALTFRDHLLRMMMGHRGDPSEAARAATEANRMLSELISLRRKEPGDDVVSALIANELKLADGTTRKLTDEEIFVHCRLIILAGGGTTWRQLGITLHALLTHPGLWKACNENRELIESAINEGVRWRPTDPMFPRLVTEDVELAGVRILAGSRVDVCLGAANRDPARWDRPDEYDIYRPAQYHLGFGLGPHQCLGQYVAKQEMMSAINGLMDRFPDMHLDEKAPAPQLVGGLEQRGFTAIPVVFR
jgi:cytochrome P450